MARPFPMLCAAAIAAGAVIVRPAAAGVFEVKGSDVEKGEIEVSSNNAVFNGFPINAERVRSSHELQVAYGFTDWFKAAAKLNFDKPLDRDFQLSVAGIETQAMLRKFQGGLGVAWFTGLDFRVHRDETNTVTFGPIVQFGTEQLQLLINPFFAKTFGPHRDEGIEFSLGWAVKRQIREGFSVGIEGYSTIPNLSNRPGVDFQEHRIGPMIYLERGLGGAKPMPGGRGSIKDAAAAAPAEGGGPKFQMEAGLLFGLTDGTQDVAFKLKAGIVF